MPYNPTLTFPYQNLASAQNPITAAPLDYKPFTFEKLSNIVGPAYNLSAIENMNTVPLPRGSEQQIFFVNNDEKIYTRQFDNSIGIVGYKQDYVQKLQDELSQAQSQLHEIFESVTKEEQEEKPKLEERVVKLEEQLSQLVTTLTQPKQEEKKNVYPRNDKVMAPISEMAQ